MDDFVKYKRVFISPHPDDVAFSCFGSLINPPADPKEALVVTVFDESRFSFHHGLSAREVTAIRRREDITFIARLGTGHKSLGLADSSLRHAAYQAEYNNFLSPRDDPIFSTVKKTLESVLQPYLGTCPIFIPLGIGSHLDHCIVREVVKEIVSQSLVVHGSHLLLYYEDLPYAASHSDYAIKNAALGVVSSEASSLLVDVDCGWDKKLAFVKGYVSQLEESTIPSILKHAIRVGGGSRRAERLWVHTPGYTSPVIGTAAWIGWEAARSLGGYSTVISKLIGNSSFTSVVRRTLLIGPLHMPMNCFQYDPYEDHFSVANQLDSEIIYRTGATLVGTQPQWVMAFHKVERKHDVIIIYLRDRRKDSHIVERLLFDFQDNISARSAHSPSVTEFVGILRQQIELPIELGEVRPRPIYRTGCFSGMESNSSTETRRLKEMVEADSSQYRHVDNDTLYGTFMAEPAAECLYALLEPEETCALIAQETLAMPTAYAALLLRRVNPLVNLRTLYYAGEIRPMANLIDGCVSPQTKLSAINGFDWEAPLRSIIQLNLSLRDHAQCFLDFKPLWHMRKHNNLRILQHGWKLDHVAAVSENVRDELRFLDRGFGSKRIDLIYHGTEPISCSTAEKERCRGLLLSYTSIAWHKYLPCSSTIIATHIARAVGTKALNRDLNLMHHLATLVALQNRHILFIVITSWSPNASTSSTFDVDYLLKRACKLNDEHANLHIRIINHFSWPEVAERGFRPTSMSRADLHRATDLSIALSTYDSFNIASLEPLSCGAVCAISTGCGVARRVMELENWGNNIVIADFTAELVADRRQLLSFPSSTKRCTPDLPRGVHDTDIAEDPDPIINPTADLIDNIFRITYDEKQAIENRVMKKLARELLLKIARTKLERAVSIEQGIKLAAQMTWKQEIEKSLIPVLKRMFEDKEKDRDAVENKLLN